MSDLLYRFIKQCTMFVFLLMYMAIILLMLCGIGAIFPEGKLSQLVAIVSILYLGVSGTIFISFVDTNWKA